MLPRRYSPKSLPPLKISPTRVGSGGKNCLRSRALDDPGMMILANALEALDRMREARALLREDGLVVRDRFGQSRPHPAAGIERDAKGIFLRNMKALGLDLEPVNARPGRPVGR